MVNMIAYLPTHSPTLTIKVRSIILYGVSFAFILPTINPSAMDLRVQIHSFGIVATKTPPFEPASLPLLLVPSES